MKYYENESTFNGVYSRDNLFNKIKDGAYLINLDEYQIQMTYQFLEEDQHKDQNVR